MAKLNLGFLLEKINKDSIMKSMGDHGNFVGVSIAVDILGFEVWNDLNKDEKDTVISKVNRIKLEEKLM